MGGFFFSIEHLSCPGQWPTQPFVDHSRNVICPSVSLFSIKQTAVRRVVTPSVPSAVADLDLHTTVHNIFLWAEAAGEACSSSEEGD